MHSTVAVIRRVAKIRMGLISQATYLEGIRFTKPDFHKWGTRLDICMAADLKTRDKC